MQSLAELETRTSSRLWVWPFSWVYSQMLLGTPWRQLEADAFPGIMHDSRQSARHRAHVAIAHSVHNLTSYCTTAVSEFPEAEAQEEASSSNILKTELRIMKAL